MPYTMKRPALGIQIIERHQKGKRTYSLFARNGSDYSILINYHLMGLCLRSKVFRFDDKDQAQMVYQNMLRRKEVFRFSGRLAQKQFDGF